MDDCRKLQELHGFAIETYMSCTLGDFIYIGLCVFIAVRS